MNMKNKFQTAYFLLGSPRVLSLVHGYPNKAFMERLTHSLNFFELFFSFKYYKYTIFLNNLNNNSKYTLTKRQIFPLAKQETAFKKCS